MRCTGERAFIAFWKTTAISFQRSRFISSWEMEIRSLPMNRAEPVISMEFSGRMRSMPIASVDLPEPDSPTRPSESPLSMVKLAWRTACTLRDLLR